MARIDKVLKEMLSAYNKQIFAHKETDIFVIKNQY